MANGVADAHSRNITNQDRPAAGLFHDDGLDIAHRLDQAKSTNGRVLRMAFQHIAAGIGIVLRHRLVDVVERHVELAEVGRIDQNLNCFTNPPMRFISTRPGTLIRQFRFM